MCNVLVRTSAMLKIHSLHLQSIYGLFLTRKNNISCPSPFPLSPFAFRRQQNNEISGLAIGRLTKLKNQSIMSQRIYEKSSTLEISKLAKTFRAPPSERQIYFCISHIRRHLFGKKIKNTYVNIFCIYCEGKHIADDSATRNSPLFCHGMRHLEQYKTNLNFLTYVHFVCTYQKDW